VADGGKPVTRENRLLSWASEMEAQLTTQRQDLRRAHMELAAAREVGVRVWVLGCWWFGAGACVFLVDGLVDA